MHSSLVIDSDGTFESMYSFVRPARGSVRHGHFSEKNDKVQKNVFLGTRRSERYGMIIPDAS